MPLSIDQQLRSLGDTISEARWHFQVWEALQEALADKASVRVMNRYLEFFRSTMLAHFESYVIACYQLCETRNDTVNFNSLKRALREVERREIDADSELVELQAEMRPLWVKISRLRNEVVGHLSREKSQVEVFKQVGVSAEDIEHFMGLAVKLHHGITYPRDKSIDGFNINGKHSTRQLLADLAKLF